MAQAHPDSAIKKSYQPTHRAMIEWSKQHCGVLQAPIEALNELMPEVGQFIAASFPEVLSDFTWDVKVHMLMPGQYPCIPNWHVDAVPIVAGIKRFDLVRPDLPIYLWISAPPLTEFDVGFLPPGVWHRYTQNDRHRGTAASESCWRGLIRATHKILQPPKSGDYWRRHSQVYLDAATFTC